MNYKKLIIIPIILLVLSLIYLFWQISTTGLNLDIDLKGGTQIIAESSEHIDEQKIESILKKYDADVRIAKGITTYTVFINFDVSIEPKDVLKTLEENGYSFKQYSIQSVGPALGASFFQQAIVVLIIAFIFMIITVFMIFKIPLISFYVALCPFFDIIETLAISQILGIKLSLATFAALLMIVGYSVDDDVMIATRVLKGIAETKEKLKSSMKTSFTTTFATIGALAALYLISTSTVITQIASVLLIGLLVDLMNTWLFDTPLLTLYVERKKK